MLNCVLTLPEYGFDFPCYVRSRAFGSRIIESATNILNSRLSKVLSLGPSVVSLDRGLSLRLRQECELNISLHIENVQLGSRPRVFQPRDLGVTISSSSNATLDFPENASKPGHNLVVL